MSVNFDWMRFLERQVFLHLTEVIRFLVVSQKVYSHSNQLADISKERLKILLHGSPSTVNLYQNDVGTLNHHEKSFKSLSQKTSPALKFKSHKLIPFSINSITNFHTGAKSIVSHSQDYNTL